MSLTTRLSWAAGSWVEPMREVGRFFTDVAKLRAWRVLHDPSAALADAQQTSAALADPFLVKHVEAIARAFWGLHARSHAIWLGGVYKMVGLVGSTALTDEIVKRFSRLLPRLKALEAELARKSPSDRLRDFGGDYVWRLGVLYQEMVILLGTGCVAEAAAAAWGFHSSTLHEKGVESIFKAYRRLCKHGNESGVIAVDRLYNIGASAVLAAWPNVMQEEATADDMEEVYGRGRWDSIREVVPKQAVNGLALAKSVYRTPVKGRDRVVPKPCSDDVAMEPAAHSRQWGCEEALLQVDLAPDGSLDSTALLERSWMSRLVHVVSAEALDLLDPIVLIKVDCGIAYLPVVQLGRCLLAWMLLPLCTSECVLRLQLTDLHTLFITDVCLGRQA